MKYRSIISIETDSTIYKTQSHYINGNIWCDSNNMLSAQYVVCWEEIVQRRLLDSAGDWGRYVPWHNPHHWYKLSDLLQCWYLNMIMHLRSIPRINLPSDKKLSTSELPNPFICWKENQ